MKTLIFSTVFFLLAIAGATAYGEETFTDEQCEQYETALKEGVECEKFTIKEFNASAFQDPDDLDDADKATLDNIYSMREAGTYVEPCRYDYKSGECHYLNPDDDPNKPKKTTWDWIVEKACESDKIKDKQLCSDAHQLSKCQQAVKETASEPVATYREFDVSDGESNLKGNIDLHDNPIQREIELKKEECRAIHEKLDPLVLGAQYADEGDGGGFVRQVDDIFPYHGEQSLSQQAIRFLEDVRLQMITDNIGQSISDELMDIAKQRQIESAELLLCEATWISDREKYNDLGCTRDRDGNWIIKNPSGVVDIVKTEQGKKILDDVQFCKDNPQQCRPDASGKFVRIYDCDSAGAFSNTGECQLVITETKSD